MQVAADARKLAEWFVDNKKGTEDKPIEIAIHSKDLKILRDNGEDPEICSLRSYLRDHHIKIISV